LSLHTQIQAHIQSKAWDDVLILLEQVFNKLKTSVLSNGSTLEHDTALPSFLRVYTAGSVLTRALWIAVEGHQKLKQYEKANETIDFLLTQNSASYLSHYRGRWHERKIINSKHMKHSNVEMKEFVVQALSDPCLHEDHRLGLTARLTKIRQDAKKEGKKTLREAPAEDCEDSPIFNFNSKRRRRKRRVSTSEESDAEDEAEANQNPNLRTFELTNEIPERTIEAEQLHV
jgi:hypothetical protein